MDITPIPMFEAKNKLPFFVHKAETEGPVFISRRNKTVGVILSIDEYNKLLLAKPKRTILEAAAEFRKKVDDTLTDEEIDLIEDNLNDLLGLEDFSLPTLEISVGADEQDVADIFGAIEKELKLTKQKFAVNEGKTSKLINICVS